MRFNLINPGFPHWGFKGPFKMFNPDGTPHARVMYELGLGLFYFTWEAEH